jgi:hypothetical protein
MPEIFFHFMRRTGLNQKPSWRLWLCDRVGLEPLLLPKEKAIKSYVLYLVLQSLHWETAAENSVANPQEGK